MKRKLTLAMAVLMAVSAGCVWSTSAPKGGVAIDFEGSINVSSDGFSMDGKVINFGQKQLTFENVSVYLYDENRTLIRSTRVGPLELESSPFSIHSDTLPKYVIVYSEDFWRAEQIDMDYYMRITTDEGVSYQVERATSKDDLPVIPDAEMNTTTGRP